MKIWTRLLIGTAAGIIAGFLLPISGGDTEILLSRIVLLMQNIAVYALLPLVFFAVIIAADELRDDRKVVSVMGHGILWTLGLSLPAAIVGALAVLGLEPQRIPPILQESRALEQPDLWRALTNTFGRNFFEGFIGAPQALVPIAVAGLVIGLTLRFDREITEPFRMVADSANRIFYRINSVLVDFLALPILAATMLLVLQTRTAVDVMLFGQLLLVVGVATGFLGFVVLPLVLRLTGTVHRPLRWLYAMTGPVLAALTTGDGYIALATGTRNAKENLGISRRSGGIVYPFATAFLKPGTALVAASGFLLVIRSYTALDISIGSLMTLIGTAWLSSLLLAHVPSGGVLLLLSYLALRYGQGMEESYLILLPIVPILQRIAAVLDTLSVAFVATVVAEKNGHRKSIEKRMMA